MEEENKEVDYLKDEKIVIHKADLELVRKFKDIVIELSEWTRPKNIKKYNGNVRQTKYGTYQAIMRNKKLWKTFKTRDEAEDYVKENNMEGEIKNMYKVCLDNQGLFLRVKGTQDKIFEIDYENKYLLDEYNLCCNKGKVKKTFYVRTYFGKKHLFLHNLIMEHDNFKTYTIDHIDRDGLNNRKYNLRLANKREQSSNKSLQLNNTSRIKGVCFHKRYQAYISYWRDENGKQKSSPIFRLRDYSEDEAKRLAYEYRQEAIKDLKHYH